MYKETFYIHFYTECFFGEGALWESVNCSISGSVCQHLTPKEHMWTNCQQCKDNLIQMHLVLTTLKSKKWKKKKKNTHSFLKVLTRIHTFLICLMVYTHHDISHGPTLITVRPYDHIDVFYDTLESLVQRFFVLLQLKQGTVHLVHEHYRFDAFCDSLTQNCLCLNAYTWKEKKPNKFWKL